MGIKHPHGDCVRRVLVRLCDDHDLLVHCQWFRDVVEDLLGYIPAGCIPDGSEERDACEMYRDAARCVVVGHWLSFANR